MNDRKINDFLERDYLEASQYNNFKKLPNFVNHKDTESKIIGWMQREDISKQIKVSNAAAACIVSTEYLEGNTSMEGVMTNLGKNYPCCGNNLEVVTGVGVFGTRFTGGAAGASRYIYVKKSKLFDLIYNKEDRAIQDPQYFEGTRIQDKHMLSVILPLHSYTYGLSIGFASLILPRDPIKLLEYQTRYLNNRKPSIALLDPYIKGYQGTIEQDVENSLRFYFRGTYQKINSNDILVTELKPFESLEGYLSYLDKLISDKVIKDYIDESENDVYKFTIKVVGSGKDSFWDIYNTPEKIRKILNLEEATNENLTMFDENNQLKVYQDIETYVKEWMEWRLGKYQKRKDYQLSKIKEEAQLNIWKRNFIELVVTDKVIINKKSKAEILAQLKEQELVTGKNDEDRSKHLSMPIYNLTSEKIAELNKYIDNKKAEYKALEAKTVSEIWIENIKDLEKML
jgi:DNA topoisomerase-2